MYGSPVPKYTGLQWPKLWNFTENDPPYFHTLSTYFDTCKVPGILMAVKMIDEGKVDKKYTDLSNDIRMGIWRHYLHFEKSGKVLPAHNYGLYFPEVWKNPTKYIIPQPEMRDVLKKMAEQNKFIFLATNSHWEYMELIMSTTLGEDWREFFDMVIANARKSFFWSGDNPMYMMD